MPRFEQPIHKNQAVQASHGPSPQSLTEQSAHKYHGLQNEQVPPSEESPSRRAFLQKSMLLSGLLMFCSTTSQFPVLNILVEGEKPICRIPAGRPNVLERRYMSSALEMKLYSVCSYMQDPELARLFENTYPQTLDSLVSFEFKKNKPSTFIHAEEETSMSLSASSIQVFRYLDLCSEPAMACLFEGLIRKQTELILNDPYGSDYMVSGEPVRTTPHTWTIDSLCYPLHLAYQFWKSTGGNIRAFDQNWEQSLWVVLGVVRERMVSFEHCSREGHFNSGRSMMSELPGLISSIYRASPSLCLSPIYVSLNIMLSRCLDEIVEMATRALNNTALAREASALNRRIKLGLNEYGIIDHPCLGKVYAWEVDRKGHQLFQEQASSYVHASWTDIGIRGFLGGDDPVYMSTLKASFSEQNAYFRGDNLEVPTEGLMEAGGSKHHVLHSSLLKAFYMTSKYKGADFNVFACSSLSDSVFSLAKQMVNTQGFMAKYRGLLVSSKQRGCEISNAIFSEMILEHSRILDA